MKRRSSLVGMEERNLGKKMNSVERERKKRKRRVWFGFWFLLLLSSTFVQKGGLLRLKHVSASGWEI